MPSFLLACLTEEDGGKKDVEKLYLFLSVFPGWKSRFTRNPYTQHEVKNIEAEDTFLQGPIILDIQFEGLVRTPWDLPSSFQSQVI